MDAPTCVGCGAPASGVYVCHNCGVPARPLTDADSQQRALDELHGRLSSNDPPPKLLENAFVPDEPRVLIEAGLRLLPLLENAAGQSGAAGRMRAIIIKLRLIGDDPTTIKAAKEFEQALESYNRSDRQMGITLSIIGVVLLVALTSYCVSS